VIPQRDPVTLRTYESTRGLAAADVVAVDLSACEGAGASAKDRAERFGTARRDDIAKYTAGYGAHDEAGGAIGTAAVIAAVASAIEAFAFRQPAFMIAAVVAIIAIGFITPVTGVGAVVVILPPAGIGPIIASILYAAR
jgi:hypothetical protein